MNVSVCERHNAEQRDQSAYPCERKSLLRGHCNGSGLFSVVPHGLKLMGNRMRLQLLKHPRFTHGPHNRCGRGILSAIA